MTTQNLITPGTYYTEFYSIINSVNLLVGYGATAVTETELHGGDAGFSWHGTMTNSVATINVNKISTSPSVTSIVPGIDNYQLSFHMQSINTVMVYGITWLELIGTVVGMPVSVKVRLRLV